MHRALFAAHPVGLRRNEMTSPSDVERRDAGFTLIELLLVIVILGVLAAIVVFSIGTTRADAVANSCKTNYAEVTRSAQAVDIRTGANPIYTWTPASADASNPLVAGAAGNGALLKTYPVRSEY